MSEELTPDLGSGDSLDAPPSAPPPPKRGPGHRGQDIRDTVAEMAAKAHEISLEAGSKMAAAMRDVVGAAAGISSFAIESARDLVNYMVRRGQMSQDEATELLREVEEAHAKKPNDLPRLSERVKAEKEAAKAAEKARLEKEKAERMAAFVAVKPVPKAKEPEKVEKPAPTKAPEKPAAKPAAKAAPKAEAPKAAEKPKAAAKAAAKTPAKAAAKAAPAKPAAKSAPKKK